MTKTRVLGLDVIRAIAAMLVVLYHYTVRYCEHDLFSGSTISWPVQFRWGCLAIVTFFLLSGYLAYRDVEKKKSPGLYIVKKVIRLFPVLWVSIIVTSVVEWLIYPEALIPPVEIVLNFTGIPGILGARYVDGAYWTLQYELIFVFWVFVAVLINQHTRKNAMDVIMLSFVVYALRGTSLARFTGIIKTVVMSEYIGVFGIGYYLNKFPFGSKSIKEYPLRYAILMIVCMLSSFMWLSIDRFVFLLLSIAAVVCVLVLKESYINRDNFFTKICSWFAMISYPLYLLHQNVGYVIMNYIVEGGGNTEFIVVIPLFISVILAYIMTRWVERPISSMAKGMMMRGKV